MTSTRKFFFYSFLGPNHGSHCSQNQGAAYGCSVCICRDAATLYDTIMRVIRDDKMLPTDKLASFACDGAVVMIGGFFCIYLLFNIL